MDSLTAKILILVGLAIVGCIILWLHFREIKRERDKARDFIRESVNEMDNAQLAATIKRLAEEAARKRGKL